MSTIVFPVRISQPATPSHFMITGFDSEGTAAGCGSAAPMDCAMHKKYRTTSHSSFARLTNRRGIESFGGVLAHTTYYFSASFSHLPPPLGKERNDRHSISTSSGSVRFSARTFSWIWSSPEMIALLFTRYGFDSRTSGVTKIGA